MRVMDVHVYGVDLVSIILRTHSPHDTDPNSGLMVWRGEAISYSRSHLVFLQGKVHSARYITQVLLPFHVIFQDNIRPHTAEVTQRVLRGVQKLPWPTRTPDFSPIEHVREMLKRKLTLSPEPATTIAELRQRVQTAWDNLSQDDIRHPYDRLHARIHACNICL